MNKSQNEIRNVDNEAVGAENRKADDVEEDNRATAGTCKGCCGLSSCKSGNLLPGKCPFQCQEAKKPSVLEKFCGITQPASKACRKKPKDSSACIDNDCNELMNLFWCQFTPIQRLMLTRLSETIQEVDSDIRHNNENIGYLKCKLRELENIMHSKRKLFEDLKCVCNGFQNPYLYKKVTSLYEDIADTRYGRLKLETMFRLVYKAAFDMDRSWRDPCYNLASAIKITVSYLRYLMCKDMLDESPFSMDCVKEHFVGKLKDEEEKHDFNQKKFYQRAIKNLSKQFDALSDTMRVVHNDLIGYQAIFPELYDIYMGNTRNSISLDFPIDCLNDDICYKSLNDILLEREDYFRNNIRSVLQHLL